jgi:hypothetical protein
MAFTITDYIDVFAKAQSLGLNAPDGIALLPRNFQDATTRDELLHESAVQTVRSLFRQNGIPETRLEREGQRILCIQENEFALVLPTLFVGGLILTGNPHLLSIALNVIANYATDFFKGIPGRRNVVLDVIVDKSFKRIHYEGEIDGLKEINQIVGKVFADDKPH